MTTETMTIHKALCELKTLDSRIKKSHRGQCFRFRQQAQQRQGVRQDHLRLQ